MTELKTSTQPAQSVGNADGGENIIKARYVLDHDFGDTGVIDEIHEVICNLIAACAVDGNAELIDVTITKTFLEVRIRSRIPLCVRDAIIDALWYGPLDRDTEVEADKCMCCICRPQDFTPNNS